MIGVFIVDISIVRVGSEEVIVNSETVIYLCINITLL